MHKKSKQVITVAVVLLLSVAVLTVIYPSATAVDDSPDYESSWELPSDGSNDTSEYYSITRSDGSSEGNIHVRAWKDNKTVRVDLTNIDTIKLYFNATDINIEDYKKFLDIAGGELTIILSSDVSTVDFTFVGIPEFMTAEIDGEEWTDYDYYSSNETMEFSLDMSTRTISLFYEGALGELVTIVLFAVMIKIIFEQFEDLPTDESDF